MEFNISGGKLTFEITGIGNSGVEIVNKNWTWLRVKVSVTAKGHAFSFLCELDGELMDMSDLFDAIELLESRKCGKNEESHFTEPDLTFGTSNESAYMLLRPADENGAYGFDSYVFWLTEEDAERLIVYLNERLSTLRQEIDLEILSKKEARRLG